MGVLGIGGLFFRAHDPDALAAWYKENLGVGGGCAADGLEIDSKWTWHAHGGPIAFSPFKQSSDYFPADKQWMLNLRVDDLLALIAALKAKGVAVETRPEWNDPHTGSFARVHDPEGNPVELWQPPAD